MDMIFLANEEKELILHALEHLERSHGDSLEEEAELILRTLKEKIGNSVIIYNEA
jgi:predicted small metal-binding protein